MVKYKKKLKESGRKPEKQNKKPVEQHFDDCGEDISWPMGVLRTRTRLVGFKMTTHDYGSMKNI